MNIETIQHTHSHVVHAICGARGCAAPLSGRTLLCAKHWAHVPPSVERNVESAHCDIASTTSFLEVLDGYILEIAEGRTGDEE